MRDHMIIDKQQIFLNAYEGCKDAFTRYCTALAFGKMNAEDLSQDVLMSAYEHFEHIRNKDQLLHYLVRAARNKHISQLRRKKFQPELLEQHSQYIYAQDASPEDLMDVQLVFQTIDKLPADQADAVLLFEWMGFSIREISQIQKTTEGAVKTRISRGRKRLRNMIEKKTDRNVLPLIFGLNQHTLPETGKDFFAGFRDLYQSFLSNSLPHSNILGVKLFVTLFFVAIIVSANFLGSFHDIAPANQANNHPLTSDIVSKQSSLSPNIIHCVIRGEVIRRDDKALIIAKFTEDLRGSKEIIPIVDGRFEYQFDSEYQEAYQLIFEDEHKRGAWKKVIFFPEEGELTFKLYPSNFNRNLDETHKNEITGGTLNTEFQLVLKSFQSELAEAFEETKQKMNLLKKKGELYNESGQALRDSMYRTRGKDGARLSEKIQRLERQNHADKTPAGKILGQQLDSLFQLRLLNRSNYIKINPSPIAWYLLYEDVRWHNQRPIDLLEAQKNLDYLVRSFPDHPYGTIIKGMLESYQVVKKGQPFIDFEAPDLDGNIVRLSDEIKGKVVLLDLWASWCGPCIRESKKMIPIYHEFKDNGFKVLGVAREFNDKNKLMYALGHLQYPWKNLVELDDQNQIWIKYNVAFSGGAMFLIGRDGQLLAIKPSPDEVRKILEEKL